MNIYKVVIADDERAPREGLKIFFQKQNCGFEVVGVADGGLQALAMAQQYQPELLITDIRMPDMDGLELARRCIELPNAPKLLFMSSYDDVVYIKAALKLKAVDYLFKPLDLKELLNVLSQIHDQLDQAAEEQRQRDIQRERLNHSLEWLRMNFLQNVVNGVYSIEEQMEENLTFLDLKMPKQAAYSVLCVAIDGRSVNKKESIIHEHNCNLSRLIEDVLSLHEDWYVFEYEKNNYVILVMEPSGKREVLEEEVKDISKEVVDAFCATGIQTMVESARIVSSRSEIPDSFQSAWEKIKAKNSWKQEKVSHHETQGEKRAELMKAAKEIKERLLHADGQLLTLALDCYFELLEKKNDISLLYAIQCVSLLVNQTGDVLPEISRSQDENSELQIVVYERLTHCKTISEMKKVVREYCCSLNRIVCDSTHSISQETVDKIQAIIHEQFMKNLSIQSIAKQVYLTPNYICMVFKQMTGQTINQNITEVRIEMAKKYLENPGIRLADIGSMVGYTEPSYFSKIFKRYVALTPKEYRQMYTLLKDRRNSSYR